MTRFTALLATAVLAFGIVGCKTNDPGVKTTGFTQYTTMKAGPEAIADAAVEVFEELQLLDIKKNATGLDARVDAKTVDYGITVKVTKKSGSDDSDVSVWVGAFGDKELGLTIINKIREKLGVSE